MTLPRVGALVMTDAQFAHLKEHEHLVNEHQSDSNYPDIRVTVEEWADGAEEDQPYEGYYYMCIDIGLDPLPPHPQS